MGVFPLQRRVPIVERDLREHKGREFSSCRGFLAVEQRGFWREFLELVADGEARRETLLRTRRNTQEKSFKGRRFRYHLYRF